MWEFAAPNSKIKDFEDVAEKALSHFMSRSDVGFKNDQHFETSIDESVKCLEDLEKYSVLVVIGLGGSSLGTKALYEALGQSQDNKRLYFLDNVDGTSLARILAKVDDPNDWAWLICSKSGGTIEVTSLLDFVNDFFKKEKNISILPNCFVVTEDKPSPLKNLAEKEQIRCLTIPLDIGGRFSVFTPLGLLPMAFLGHDLSRLYHGFTKAKIASETVRKMTSFFLSERESTIFYSFQYCDDLRSWSLWLQQLWSESLGKAIDRKKVPFSPVPTLVPCRGASDQHSVLQQVIEGQESKCVGFHRVLSSEQGGDTLSSSLFEDSLLIGRPLGRLLAAEAEATQLACEQAGLKTFSLSTNTLNEESIAYLMTLWMLTVGALGEAWDVDAFNQPGVESGKIIARRVLQSEH